MVHKFDAPFSRDEALALWARLVAGWANSLNVSGNRTLMDGITNDRERGGSYEGVTRMLWGLGSWLADPKRPVTVEWRGVTYDLEHLTRRGLVNGCDPHALGSWHNEAVSRPDWDQRTVESAQVAFASWQTRQRIWATLSVAERGNIIDWLDQVGQRPSRWGNNWALFWVLNHTARKKLGAPYDQSIIDEVLTTYLDGVYCGDGWYDDGEVRGVNYFDNYNTWVFAMHVMAWATMDGDSMPARRDVLLERVQVWMQHFPYFFAADGAVVEYGRSQAYKFCRLGAPLWAYKLGIWPHSVGMLKRLVGKHMRWYVDRGAVRPDGTLRQALTSTGSPDVIERYISTGATYWAIQAFSGLWALADDDPFWSAEEEPLPAEQGDFTKVHPIPGWVLVGRSGQVQLYNAGVTHPGYGNKYAKLVYSTQHPYNVGFETGQPSLDSGLYFNARITRGQREHVLAYAVSESWLRSRYTLEVAGQRHIVDTTLIPLGDLHLRAHRITLTPDPENISAQDGSAPLGYDPGAVPTIHREDGWLFAEYGDSAVGIKGLSGYTEGAVSLPGSANSIYAYNLVTRLNAPLLAASRDLICLVYAGKSPNVASFPTIERYGWNDDGQFSVRVNGELITVPPL